MEFLIQNFFIISKSFCKVLIVQVNLLVLMRGLLATKKLKRKASKYRTRYFVRQYNNYQDIDYT